MLHRWEFLREKNNWANIFFKYSGNPIFGQLFGHQRAVNEAARNTKMYRGQETHPIRINARYEIDWANSVFKNSGNPIFGQIFGHQRAENEVRNAEMYRGQKTHPIRMNARYEINWANIFFKKFRKPHLGRNKSTRGPKMRLGTRKYIGVKKLTP